MGSSNSRAVRITMNGGFAGDDIIVVNSCTERRIPRLFSGQSLNRSRESSVREITWRSLDACFVANNEG